LPLVSAQLYVQSLLVGMTPPGDTGLREPISALITPLDPDVNPDGIARVYVWPAKFPEKRRAVPRNTGKGTPAGWKQIIHEIQVFLVWMDSPDDPNADVNFPYLIDWVADVLRTSPNDAFYTDPGTGRVSQFVNLGEVMIGDFVPPRTLADMAMRRYDARIQCSLLELFQA
jgi:hypothetical protein